MAEQTATLNGADLNITIISDRAEPSIIRHELPLENGALLEDMGLKAKEVVFTAIFDHNNYDDFLVLRDALEDQEEWEFVHPTDGLMFGRVALYIVSQDATKKTARVEITFVEDTQSRKEAVIKENVESKTEDFFAEGIEQAVITAKDDMEKANDPGLFDKVLDVALGIIEQFDEVVGSVRTYIKRIDSAVSTLEGTLTAISNPANSLIGSIEFATTLPGRILKTVAQTAERYITLYEDLESAPEVFVNSYKEGFAQLKETLGVDDNTISSYVSGETVSADDSVVPSAGSPTSSGITSKRAEAISRALISKNMDVVGSLVLAFNLGRIYGDDDTKRQLVIRTETVKTFDNEGRLSKIAPIEEIFTVDEIERSLAAEREYLQQAIDKDSDGSISALKDMGLALLRNVNQVKLEREKIVTYTEPLNNPLVLIMLQQGLPYNMINRIIAINPGISPNFVRGEINLYAA